MPRRELRHPKQVEDWLLAWNGRLSAPGEMILIGSGALLWHAFQRGLNDPLPENSMDVDLITNSDEIARLGYEAIIGSEFELERGWHVNLMPDSVLREFPLDWKMRAKKKNYGLLSVTVPATEDLLIPKRKRNDARDRAQEAWARTLKLI